MIYCVDWPTNANVDSEEHSAPGVLGCGDPPINVKDDTDEDMGFASRHTGGAQFLLVDGSVRFVSENIGFSTTIRAHEVGSQLYQHLLHRRDGNPVSDF